MKYVVQKLTRKLVNAPLGFHVAKFIRRVYKRLSNKGNYVLTSYQSTLRMWVDLSDFTGSTIFFYDFLPGDRSLIEFIKKTIQPDDVVFDIGAHIGIMTLLVARQAYNGAIHAFEASETNFLQLKHNVELNNLNHVHLNQKAAWHTPTTLTLYDQEANNSGTFSVYAGSNWQVETPTVEAIRLDEYLAQNSDTIKRVDFIKLDIEGAELNALAGAQDLLKRFQPKVVAELSAKHLARSNRTVADVFEFWDAQGYEVFEIMEAGELRKIEDKGIFAVSEEIEIYCQPKN